MSHAASDATTADPATEAAALGAALLLADLHEAVAEATAQLATLAATASPTAVPFGPILAAAEPPAVVKPLREAWAQSPAAVTVPSLAQPAAPEIAMPSPAAPINPDEIAPLPTPTPLSSGVTPLVQAPATPDVAAPTPAASAAAEPLPAAPQAPSRDVARTETKVIANWTASPPQAPSAPKAIQTSDQGPAAPHSAAAPPSDTVPSQAMQRTSWPAASPNAAPVTPAAGGNWPAPNAAPEGEPRSSPSAMPSAAPPPRQSSGPTGGDVFLDGARVGRWLADTLAREAGGPATGGTGFDPPARPDLAGRPAGQWLMTAMTLGPVAFDAFEVPGRIEFGGGQRLAVHALPGGVRIVDAMGRDDAPVAWSGVFTGPTAGQRVRLLDLLRVAGEALELVWDDFLFQVVIAGFEVRFERPNWIPYRLSCVVLSDLAVPDQLAIALSAQLVGDLAMAGLCPGLDLNSANLALSAGTGTALGTQTYGHSAAALAAASNQASGLLSAGSADLGQAQSVAASAAAAGQMAQASSALGYLKRAQGNLARAGS